MVNQEASPLLAGAPCEIMTVNWPCQAGAAPHPQEGAVGLDRLEGRVRGRTSLAGDAMLQARCAPAQPEQPQPASQ